MWSAQAEIVTRADPVAMWALWENAERWKEWNEQIASAELRGEFAVDSQARIRFKGRPMAMTFTITALEPERLFIDETRLPGAKLGHEHALRPRGNGATTIRHRLYFDGPLSKLYGLLMGRQMRAAVAAFVQRELALLTAPDMTG
jgi:hypothetical protein